MTFKHVGVRPKHKIVLNADTFKLKNFEYFEHYPDGSYKIWNKRLLASGCNNFTLGDDRYEGLIYCEYCDEYFNENQFIEVDAHD